MGMFDSFYDANNNEWQTKALDRVLARYVIGDAVSGPPIDYQMQVFGDRGWRFATIRNGHLAVVPADRNPKLPLRLYSGVWAAAGEEN